MHRGRWQVGAPMEITATRSLFVADFIGQANILPGEVRGGRRNARRRRRTRLPGARGQGGRLRRATRPRWSSARRTFSRPTAAASPELGRWRLPRRADGVRSPPRKRPTALFDPFLPGKAMERGGVRELRLDPKIAWRCRNEGQRGSPHCVRNSYIAFFPGVHFFDSLPAGSVLLVRCPDMRYHCRAAEPHRNPAVGRPYGGEDAQAAHTETITIVSAGR